MYKSKIKKSRIVVLAGVFGVSMISFSCGQQFTSSQMKLGAEEGKHSQETTDIYMHTIECASIVKKNDACDCEPFKPEMSSKLYSEAIQNLKTNFYSTDNGAYTAVRSYMKDNSLVYTQVRKNADLTNSQKTKPVIGYKNSFFKCGHYEFPQYMEIEKGKFIEFSETDRLRVGSIDLAKNPFMPALDKFFTILNESVVSGDWDGILLEESHNKYKDKISYVDFSLDKSLIENYLYEITALPNWDLCKLSYYNSNRIGGANISAHVTNTIYEYIKIIFKLTKPLEFKLEINNKKLLNYVEFSYNISAKKFTCKETESELQKFYMEKFGIFPYQPKEISLHFMLHLNEDFDDDLLSDAINLLHD